MKKQQLPQIIIEGILYEVLIDSMSYRESVCYKCDLGLKKCLSLYRDFEECPCNTMGQKGYRGRSYLRAKKAGQ